MQQYRRGVAPALPYDLNPLNINPLKDLIERFVDFEAIRRDSDLELFISATDVRTGETRVFPRIEITADAGQRATRRFLDTHFDAIGRRRTIERPAEKGLQVVE